MIRLFRHKPDDLPDGLTLVVGLGNPGAQYELTRHNVGFMTVNVLAQRHDLRFRASKQRADVARGSIAGRPIILAQPTTFMNDSGQAVSRLLQYYKLGPGDLIVIADDLDLPFGTLRMRPSGSSGGQKGIQSIIQSIGSDGFTRLRLGIGRPRGDAVDHVLNRFPAEEETVLPQLLGIAADAIEDVLQRGVKDAMNGYNRDWLPELAGMAREGRV